MILKRKKKHLAHDGPLFFPLQFAYIETRTMLFGEAWRQADYSLSPASDGAGCMHD